MGVISDRGLQIGRLSDIIFDEADGRIVTLIVKPSSKEIIGGTAHDNSGNALIPFNAVMSIRDYIVVNERVLAIQQLKAQPKLVPQTQTPTLPPQAPPSPPKV